MLLGADRQYLERNGYTTYRFYVFIICVICVNVPSIAFQLKSRGTSVYVFLNTVNRRNSSLARVFSVFSSEARDEFFRFLQRITLSPTLVDPALVSVIRVVDGQDTGLSAQPAEQPTSDRHRPELHLQSALVQASVFLKLQPTGQLKRTRPLTSYPVSQWRVLPTKSRSWSRVFTDQEGLKCVLQNSRLL